MNHTVLPVQPTSSRVLNFPVNPSKNLSSSFHLTVDKKWLGAMLDLLLALSSPPPQDHRHFVLRRRHFLASVLPIPPYLVVASPFHHLLGLWPNSFIVSQLNLINPNRFREIEDFRIDFCVISETFEISFWFYVLLIQNQINLFGILTFSYQH